MAFTKNVLIGFLIFSLIITAFMNLMGNMNTLYNKNLNADIDTQDYLNKVENVTSGLSASLQPSQVSESGGFVGDIQRFVSGGSLTANILNVIFIRMPLLVNEGIDLVLDEVGLKWLGDYIKIAFSLMVILTLIKFTLGRALDDPD